MKKKAYSQYLREEVPYFVDEDVEMIEYYDEFDAYIEWESSDEDVIKIDICLQS